MYQIKTASVLILSITLMSTQSFAQSSARDCFQQTMKDEGIANMQNRFNPNTIAGKAAIRIWNHCLGLQKTSLKGAAPAQQEPQFNDAIIETLECTQEKCPGVGEETPATEIEV